MITKFTEQLIEAGLPVDGISDSGKGQISERYKIQFRPEATTAQRQQAEQMKSAFDWRPRRPKTEAELEVEVRALTPADFNKLVKADEEKRVIERLQLEPGFGRDNGVPIDGDVLE